LPGQEGQRARLGARSTGVGVVAGDRDLPALEPCLHPESAAGAPLAGEAMADRDAARLAVHLKRELSAVAGGFAHC
jgi:hypothetical protein